MKKTTIILYAIFLLGVSVASTPVFAQTCNSQTPGVKQVNDGAGNITFICNGAVTDPLTGQTNIPSTANSQSGTQSGNSTQGKDLGYTPLEPIPGLTTGANGGTLDFASMLRNVYKIAIIIGALFSVLMLTLSGIRYMLSDVVTDKEKAKKRITACLYGLVLIAASWLILNTINPQLVTFSLNPGTVSVSAPTNTAANPTGAATQTPQQQALTQTINTVAATPAGTQVFTPAQCASAAADSGTVQQQYYACCQSQPMKCNSAGKQACGYTDVQATLQKDAVITDSCTTQ